MPQMPRLDDCSGEVPLGRSSLFVSIRGGDLTQNTSSDGRFSINSSSSSPPTHTDWTSSATALCDTYVRFKVYCRPAGDGQLSAPRNYSRELGAAHHAGTVLGPLSNCLRAQARGILVRRRTTGDTRS